VKEEDKMGFPASSPGRKRTTPKRSYPSFPEGDNHIDDPDVKTIADLARHYPLPKGYEYRVRANGSPYIRRSSDGMECKIIIEEGLLTFDEPFTRPDGKTGYKTIEVFKQ
jgi:hypothetical protein